MAASPDPSLNWVYPPTEHLTYERAVLLVGQLQAVSSTPAAYTLAASLNDQPAQPVPLSVSGFFGTCTPQTLIPGENRLTLTVTDAQGERVEQFTRTLQCHGDERFYTLLQPSAGEALPLFELARETLSLTGELTLLPGAEFALQGWLQRDPEYCHHGLKMFFQIEGLPEQAVNLHTSDSGNWETRQAVFGELHHIRPPLPRQGWIDTIIRIPNDCPSLNQAACVLYAEQTPSPDHPEQVPLRQTLILPLTLTVWPKPGWGQIKCDNNSSVVARTAPQDGARLTPLLNGMGGRVSRIENGWVCLQLGDEGFHVWVTEADVTVNCPTVVYFASERQPARLPLVRLGQNEQQQPELWISLPGRDTPPPVQVALKPEGLSVILYNTVSYCDFVREGLAPASGVSVYHRQAGPTTVEIVLSCPNLIGYLLAFDSGAFNSGGLRLRLRQLPSTLEGIRILLDPGHGGKETGAIAPNGTPEKTLNLRLAEQVAAALRAVGFSQVALTRTTDVDLSLDERVKQARDHNADIILSLHHNALPDGRDPSCHQGPVMLYYQPTSRALAWHLQQALLPLWELPANDKDSSSLDTVYQDSLALTRISTGLAVLVEAGYLTHAQDAERLLNPDFMHRWAATLASALANYGLYS